MLINQKLFSRLEAQKKEAELLGKKDTANFIQCYLIKDASVKSEKLQNYNFSDLKEQIKLAFSQMALTLADFFDQNDVEADKLQKFAEEYANDFILSSRNALNITNVVGSQESSVLGQK